MRFLVNAELLSHLNQHIVMVVVDIHLFKIIIEYLLCTKIISRNSQPDRTKDI